DATTGAATGWTAAGVGGGNVLAVGGARLYVGDFAAIAGLDLTTGGGNYSVAPLTNDPLNGPQAGAIVPTDSALYVGGRFNFCNGLPRHDVAAVDLVTGVPTGWAPDPRPSGTQSAVSTLALGASTIYAGGDFSQIGGLDRPGLAALLPET